MTFPVCTHGTPAGNICAACEMEQRPAQPLIAWESAWALVEHDPRGAAWRDRSVGEHVAAVLRHLGQSQKGETDKDTGQLHIVHALARLAMAAEIELGRWGK